MLFIVIMSSSSSCKRAVARPRASSKSVTSHKELLTLHRLLKSSINLNLLCTPKFTHRSYSWHPASGVSPDARGWSLYLTQLGGFFFRKIKNNFFLKILFFSKFSFFQDFLKKRFFQNFKESPLLQVSLIRVYAVQNSLIFLFSRKISLSRDKASELSQVERSPTCIGADAGDRDKVNLNNKV